MAMLNNQMVVNTIVTIFFFFKGQCHWFSIVSPQAAGTGEGGDVSSVALGNLPQFRGEVYRKQRTNAMDESWIIGIVYIYIYIFDLPFAKFVTVCFWR